MSGLARFKLKEGDTKNKVIRHASAWGMDLREIVVYINTGGAWYMDAHERRHDLSVVDAVKMVLDTPELWSKENVK